MSIPRFLRQRRKAMGLTQAEVAERMKVGQSHVSSWERGVCSPSLDNSIAWAASLGFRLAIINSRGEEERVST